MCADTHPIYKLITRFSKFKNCDYIFVCEKDGSIPLSNSTSIPIKLLYFMVEKNHTFQKLDDIDMSRLSTYNNIFAFQELNLILPKTCDEAKEFKVNCLRSSKMNNSFARTFIPGSMFIDHEKKIEWQPEPEHPLNPYQIIPPQIRKSLLLPYPFEDVGEDGFFVFEDGVINFQNDTGVYVFGHVVNDKIVIRHFNPVKSENKVTISLYVELTLDGQYFCKFTFDDEENMKFGKHTICGYPDLSILHKRIYNFDAIKYVTFLIKNGKGYDNNRHQESKIKERQLYGFAGLTENDDEDGGDMFKFGMTDAQFLQFKDIYGGY